MTQPPPTPEDPPAAPRPARPAAGLRRASSRWHYRWASGRRRLLVDTHDQRFGLFWVPDDGTCHGAWLHLPFLVIDLTRNRP